MRQKLTDHDGTKHMVIDNALSLEVSLKLKSFTKLKKEDIKTFQYDLGSFL